MCEGKYTLGFISGVVLTTLNVVDVNDFQNVLHPIWVCILQTLSNGWPETDVNTRCKQGREHTVGIHSKTEELSSKSVSGLRELSDW